MPETIQPGALYIVSTPIGNLEDITYRAVKILSGVDLIAAEDTRKTHILLEHYRIQKPLVSYYSYNETKRIPELITKLQQGSSIALVSDAGTPGISDPAFRIIRASLNAHVPVIPVPGPSALLAALVVSGLPMDEFVYDGFLPIKKGRKTKLERLSQEPRSIVLYESPHRLLKTLNEIHAFLGDRNISVCRELTKKFEEVQRGKISEVREYFSTHPIKGEFVLVIEGSSERPSTREDSRSDDKPTRVR